jgi:3-hydroxyacyl-[acyl-carrier-protein] dehydratase
LILDRDAVMAWLPHRDPMLLIDGVLELEPGVRAVALFRVHADMFWVPGHFPAEAILPGVLLAEAMAQAAAVAVLAGREGTAELVYLLGYDGLRFRRPVRPGDEVTLEARVTGVRRRMYTFDVEARVGEHRVADGKLLASGPG